MCASSNIQAVFPNSNTNMKRLLTFCSLFTVLLAQAATGPIRVLYLGAEDTDAGRHAHVLMRDLGRDAIWFDYTTGVGVTAGWVAKFDVVLMDTPKAGFSFLQGFDQKKIIVPDFSVDNHALVAAVREQVLTAVGDARKKDWEAFLAQREPEKREPNPNVANYERRAEAITFVHPLSVKGSKERTQVAPDLRLELFAGEPDIAKPIAFAWDERGRCWVAETRDYPHDVKPSGEGRDSIKICEDTDGDGKADKFTVFADKLNIPTSLVFANGGIIVSQPPRFLLLKDTNGDDKADVREEIMTGWGIGDTHAQANNLHYGYDNWLYGCVGYSGFNGTVGGKTLRFAQGTFRFKADGSALEFLHQFSNNSWGHSANDAGDQFGGTANGAPIFYGGIPATAAPAGSRVMSAKKINVVDVCHTITPNFRQVDVFGGYTAAAGSAFIYSANLPSRLQGKAMVCEPTMKNIALMDVQPKGAGYVAKDAFNLVASSDEWMSPVFAEVGPDGAVWFSDWQNFIIQHNPTPSVQRGGYDARTGVGGAHENPLRDHERGRIYRVVWEKAQKPAITSLKDASTETLVNALSSDNQFWRLTAQRLLVEGKKADAREPLKKVVVATNASVGAVHALSTLRGLGALDEKTHLAGLLAKDARVRRAATRALGRDDQAKKLFFSAGVITDPDLITRKAAFLKLGDFATTKEIQSVVGSLAKNPAHKSDEWLAEATRLLLKKHKADNYKEGPNLLPNPGLEVTGTNGLPEGWRRRDYGGRRANQEAEWTVVTNAHSGERAVRCISRGDADTSLYANVQLKPNTMYRLSGWVRARGGLRGKISFNDHAGRAETEQVRRDGDWTLVEVEYNSGTVTNTSINILHVARGDGYFDDVKLCELIPAEETPMQIVGVAKRGEDIFHNHVARCVLCHTLKGQGSTVGPALDGIAARATSEYLKESLLEPSKVIAKGFEGGGDLSPMPPMGDIFSPQEIEDVLAYLKTLK
jgi:putative membrane-bound dehydrogenase-like protein